MPHKENATAEYNNTVAILCGLFSAMSIISLVQKYLAVGLVPIALEFVTFYRKAINFIMEPVLGLLPFSMPSWYKDAYVISFVVLLLECRAIFAINTVRPGPNRPFLLRRNFLAFYVAAVASLLLLGLLSLLWKPFELHALLRRQGTAHQRTRVKYVLTSLGAAIVGSLVFFTLNSQL